MYSAVESNKLACAELLLEKGANPNVKEDFYKTTPLHLASRFGYVEMVKLLIRYKADVNLSDHEGKIALDIARENQKDEVIKILTLQSAQQGDAPEPASPAR